MPRPFRPALVPAALLAGVGLGRVALRERITLRPKAMPLPRLLTALGQLLERSPTPAVAALDMQLSERPSACPARASPTLGAPSRPDLATPFAPCPLTYAARLAAAAPAP